MRIVVASSPKSGNHWIKCLLGAVYDLRWLGGEVKPDLKPEGIAAWAAAGAFPPGTIFQMHARFTPALADVIAATPAHIVTIVRDPYDVFVSLYHWAQERAERGLGNSKERPRRAVIGKPIDHPDVLAFLADEFGTNLRRAAGWLLSGRAIPVRYEELHTGPVAALARVTDAIAPVDRARLEDAVETCRAENMRQMNDKLAWHVRAAKVGDSRAKLGEAHLAVFRDRHAAAIRDLGYEVR